MWMMGYNDGVEFNSSNQDSLNRRNNLRPLIPRSACTNSPCFGNDFLTLNHHLAAAMAAADRNKRELNCTQQVVVSSRWNPTPEQLQTLEELYRRGTRTPSAEQIQHITAQLRRYGKIEGKNVFYWFQNHKARERQKRRRQLDSNDGEKKESSPEENGTVIFEVEQSKNWASPTNSSTIAEKNVATQGAAATDDAESKPDGWLQFHEAQLKQKRNATWQMTNNLTFSSSPSTAHSPPPVTTTSMEPYMINLDNFEAGDGGGSRGGGGGDAQILQLFPLGSGGGCDNNKEEEGESGGAMSAISNATPYQFFEFLPLKN